MIYSNLYIFNLF